MNTINPKISVIVPVYNTSTYLRRCLDSILEQDFTSYEVICVNDGSTDNSLEILREYEKKSEKIKVINQVNSGVAKTRNTALKHANGDYLAFLDSDDFVRENYLSRLYDAAIDTRSDIVICNFYRYYEQINLAKPVFYKFRRGVFNKYDILKGLIPDNLIHSYLWNKLWKREIFEDFNSFPDMKFEDLAIMSQLIYKADKIAVINDALYYYRIRKTSIVRNICLQTQNDYMKAYALIRLFLKDTGEYSRLKRYYFYFSLKAYIVMLAVNIMLFKEYPSFKLFLQNTMSIKSFMKACREDNFKMTKEDILNYNVLSSEVKMSILNANKVSK
ncbi:glycosyltransferase family 2 protein [Intestinibacter bartlettii]|uniref:glycosyltransferase family 2 protein n=1 Tax=Intestinibacter bartlettii TaxID=261299 RepID=UPI0024312FEC|nr:glycosyltransferase [Intestinibacter bartlettii]MDU6823329.1 glycosyltransferase [Intestinibacter bartlettii]